MMSHPWTDIVFNGLKDTQNTNFKVKTFQIALKKGYQIQPQKKERIKKTEFEPFPGIL
jgi:hypothetical protein